MLDSACLSFLGMLPTFTGFSHGVNQKCKNWLRVGSERVGTKVAAILSVVYDVFGARSFMFSAGYR